LLDEDLRRKKNRGRSLWFGGSERGRRDLKKKNVENVNGRRVGLREAMVFAQVHGWDTEIGFTRRKTEGFWKDTVRPKRREAART